MGPSITKLLVADRGATARRIFRTAREMGIATVAVFTEGDRDAVFVADADEAVALERISNRGPGAYLDAAALVEAARRAGADAVHPGCGRLAEDAGFAWRAAEAGLAFVGPPPEAIAIMGSKLEAKSLAAEAGVPVLTAEEVDGYPPGKLEAAAEVLGWPVAVKASAGAGVRVVHDGEDLVGTVEAVRREATAAFGDGTVFLEPWLEAARHIEVQVFGDATGRVVHLFERHCSRQRRHRKVVIEAPAPQLPQTRREQLLEAAVTVAGAAGYVGAGTVEFLVDDERFWFLEMSTRLDIDHPVSEAVFGIDFVRLQLTAAEGRPLPVEARHCTPSGHAVGVRLYASDPGSSDGEAGAGDGPSGNALEAPPSRLRRFEIEAAPGLRVETGVASGSPVGGDDGLLATVVAHAGSRAEAVRRLAAALEGMRLHGLRTNRHELTTTLRHPGFVACDAGPGPLDRFGAPHADGRGGSEAVRLHAVAAALADPAGPPAGPGGRTGPHGPRAGSAVFGGPAGVRVEVAYRVDPAGTVTDVSVDGIALPGLRLGAVTAGAVDLEVDGLRRRVAVSRAGDVVDCDSPLGHTELVLLGAGWDAGA